MGPDAVESMFAEIGLLVLEGDAAGLAAKVSELSAERRAPSQEADAEAAAPDPATAAAVVQEAPNGRPPEDSRRDAPAPLVHSPHS